MLNAIKNFFKDIFNSVEKTIGFLVIFGLSVMIVILISLGAAGVFSPNKKNNVIESKTVIGTTVAPVIPEVQLNSEIDLDIQVERQAEIESKAATVVAPKPTTEVVFNDEVVLVDMQKLKELLAQYTPLYSSATNTLTMNQDSKKVYLSQGRLDGWFQIGTYNLDRINDNDYWRSNEPKYIKLHSFDVSDELGKFYYRTSQEKIQALILDIVNKFFEEGAEEALAQASVEEVSVEEVSVETENTEIPEVK